MRCAVLGDPVRHSLSPALHRAAYAELGLDWTYDALRVPTGTLADFLAGLGEEWRGLSLTMPLKREAVPLADELTAVARRAGAANTLVLDGGRSLGENTDVPGARAAIRERYAGPVATATILGGGATATSVGLALVDLGCRELTVAARDATRAAPTVATVSAHPAAPAVRWVDLAGLEPAAAAPAAAAGSAGPAGLVVSTVPAAAQSPELVALCVTAPVVFDVVYDPWPTPLSAAVARGGGTLVSGLDLLAHQAVLQLACFLGRPGSEPVPVELLRSAGREELARRLAG